MALENVSKAKLAEHKEQKQAERVYAEQIRKAKELADKREALERMAVINKDLIDFTHPDMTKFEKFDE
jgi:F0F1-type ATP synthase gamma subunit